ncbi:MAG TPA: protein kinase, partial [Acidobacteriota bacterium]|nr:protein kinase [Acidobacteriota bacterium]
MTEFHSLFFTDQPGTLAPTDPFVGRTIDKYFIEQRIGRGGMGAVYRAHHTMFDKCVAIKLLSSNLVDDPKTFERFRREATAAARLKHVNVVGVTDFAKTDEGIPYLVMEYVDGYSLRYILDHKPVLSP